jgi:lipopolysaccharide/colanic/teichoic acid biosynthesis glycosyltransferase
VDTTGQDLKYDHRRFLIDELYRGYGDLWFITRPVRALRVTLKIYTWKLVVGGAKFLKRAMDIFVASSISLILSPLLIAVAVIIRMEDGGPALFWQTRVGQWGREFRFPKFRSMVPDAEQQRAKVLAGNQHGSMGITFKMKRDPRITKTGAILRKLSIDELPQLWCVLRGEMSLVGPRPPLPVEVERYALCDRRRLEVKPGLTCIWQVSGRSELPFEQQSRLDAQYIDSHSIVLDIVLLLKTIPAILGGRGAY